MVVLLSTYHDVRTIAPNSRKGCLKAYSNKIVDARYLSLSGKFTVTFSFRLQMNLFHFDGIIQLPVMWIVNHRPLSFVDCETMCSSNSVKR